jgi:hypothetical protein
MIVLFPIAWPFLVIWLMFRFWRVTLLLLAIGLVVAVSVQSPAWGTALGLSLLVLAIRGLAAHQAQAERAGIAARQRLENRRNLAAADQYAMMEIQADMNARAMARVAREM